MTDVATAAAAGVNEFEVEEAIVVVEVANWDGAGRAVEENYYREEVQAVVQAVMVTAALGKVVEGAAVKQVMKVVVKEAWEELPFYT